MAPAHLFLQMLSNGSSLRWVFCYRISAPCWPEISLPAVLPCCRQAIKTKELPPARLHSPPHPRGAHIGWVGGFYAPKKGERTGGVRGRKLGWRSRREGLAEGSCPFGAAREIRMAGIPCVPNRTCMAVSTLTPPQDQSPSLVRSLPACCLSLLQAGYQNKGTPVPLHSPPAPGRGES